MVRYKEPILVTDEEEAIARLQNETEIALDLETGGLSPYKDPTAVVSMYGAVSGVGAVLHVRGYLSERLRTFLSDSHRTIVTHNGAGFDYLFLANAGVDVFAPDLYDTMVAEGALLTSERNNNGVSLKATAKRRLDKDIDKSLQKSTWMAESLSQAQIEYCVGDIAFLLRIRDEQLKHARRVDRERGAFLERCLQLETELLKTTVRMELNGIPISLTELSKYRAKRYDQIQQATKMLKEVLGDINLNSIPQLKRAFQDKLKTELESTDEEHLKFYRDLGGPLGEVCAALLLYREGNRPVNYYDDEWVKRFVYKGRVHCQYMQCKTETGRYSCSDPNLQNIPRDMRYLFGQYPFVKGDYSQIEVRVLAAIAGDEDLLRACSEEDVHRQVAAMVWDIPPEIVTEEQRQIAKSMTFTLLFGGGAMKLYSYAKQNGASITEDEARSYVKKFFSRFQKANELKVWAQTKTGGESALIEFPTGLRRIISGPKLRPTTWLNSRAQGAAAAGLKMALRECQKAGIDKYLIETVHDELAGIPPEDEAMDFAEELNECMVRGMKKVTTAPVAVEMTLGDSWAKGARLTLNRPRKEAA